MNTYNISVKGTNIISQLSQSDLQENLKLIRGLVWTSGGNDKDIEITLNKAEPPCNK
jgi:hypothetical protein